MYSGYTLQFISIFLESEPSFTLLRCTTGTLSTNSNMGMLGMFSLNPTPTVSPEFTTDCTSVFQYPQGHHYYPPLKSSTLH